MHGGMCFYQNDGSGRDIYISGNNGGFFKEYQYLNNKPHNYHKNSNINGKHLYNPVFSKPINRYFCDGQGRDVYIFSQNSRNSKMKKTNKAELENMVRNDEEQKQNGNQNGKTNPAITSIDNVKSKKNKQIAENVLRRVFYANAENIPSRQMLPKTNFATRNNIEISTPLTSELNENIKYKDRYQYYYPNNKHQRGFSITQENLSSGIRTLAAFSSKLDK